MMNLIRLVYGTYYDEAWLDNERLDPADSLTVFNHSPDGFAWGYGGSGPAQLALAILLAAGIPAGAAVTLHQDFKFEFLAALDQEADALVEVDIGAWVSEKIAGRRTGL